MLRETKLGLVVASAFVALTTVVVVSRLKQPREPAPDATPAARAAGMTPPKLSPSNGLPITPTTPAPGNPPSPLSKVVRADAREMVPGDEKPDLSTTTGGNRAMTTVPAAPVTKDGLPDFGSLPEFAGQTPQQNSAAPLPSPNLPAPVSASPPGQASTLPAAGSSLSGGGLPAPPAQGSTNSAVAAGKAPLESKSLPSAADLGIAPPPAKADGTPTPNGKSLLPFREAKGSGNMVASLPPTAETPDLPTPPGAAAVPAPAANPPAPAVNGNAVPGAPAVVAPPASANNKNLPDLSGTQVPTAPAVPLPPAAGAPNGQSATGSTGTGTTTPGGPATSSNLTSPPTPPVPAVGAMTLTPLPQPVPLPQVNSGADDGRGAKRTTLNGQSDSALGSNQAAPSPPTLPAPGQGPGTVAQAGAQDNAGKINAPNPPMPPVGMTPNAVSPPVQVPPPVNAPRPRVNAEPSVKVYDEQIYTCKPEDTSLEALSERVYRSKLYAQALLRFNREHPRGADELQTNPPQLRAGTQIHVPPLDVLESSYPDLFPGLKPLAPPAPTGSVQVGQSSPVAQTDRQLAPVVAVTRPPAAETPAVVPSVRVPAPGGQGNILPANGVAASGKEYRVAPGGEPMYRIAQQTLGNGSRWPEILRLNPQLNPEQPIPAGTPVMLPADARVTP